MPWASERGAEGANHVFMTSGGPPCGGSCAVPPPEQRAERPRLAAGAVCARITLGAHQPPRASRPIATAAAGLPRLLLTPLPPRRYRRVPPPVRRAERPLLAAGGVRSRGLEPMCARASPQICPCEECKQQAEAY